MTSPDVVAEVLQYFPAATGASRWTALGSAGGFSGARLWRVTTLQGDYCLRRWPPDHPDETRLQFIHSVLRLAYDHGLREAPLPVPSIHGETFVRHHGFLWELAPWMPGEADYHRRPSVQKLQSALQWLARFHVATAPPRATVAPSPGIQERSELLRRLQLHESQEIARRLQTIHWPEFAIRGQRILKAFAREAHNLGVRLAASASVACPLQPCIRDIWHDHVLFLEDKVSGVVDFGAMRIECVSADISRLLGSLVGNDPQGWRQGLEAYSRVRPLSVAERQLCEVFDASTSLLSGMNWLRWICLEQRSFDEPDRVLARLDEILLRLPRPQVGLIE